MEKRIEKRGVVINDAIMVNMDPKKDHLIEINAALEHLKKRLKKNNFHKDIKKKEYYMSPSQKRKYRHNEALKRLKRDEKKHEWYMKTHKEKIF